MQNPIYRIVYVSSAVKPFDKAELLDLMRKACGKNQLLGLTGMLLYKDGSFIQLLEGEQSVVRELYRRIIGDPRHSAATLVMEEEVPERLFSDWSMGFRDLSDPDVQSTPGYSQFMNTRRFTEDFGEDPTGCLQLLSLFRSGL